MYLNKNIGLIILFCISLLGFSSQAYAQKERKKSGKNRRETPIKDKEVPADTTTGKNALTIDPATQVPLTIDLEEEEEEEEEEKPKKKRKKKVFYGIKTKKGYAKSGFGDRAIIETFFYLKSYEEPNHFVRDIYWYDFRRKNIRTTTVDIIKKDNAGVLHGPYKKMTVDGDILEEGIFFKGTKHGRWVTYDRNDILQDKQKYTKGWPRESEVAYYNNNIENLQEIIPIEYGIKEGNYFYFHKSGRIAVQGEYQNDAKIGYWIEYYDFQDRRKKEIKYPDNPFDKKSKPYITREWNPEGQEIYANKKKSNLPNP